MKLNKFKKEALRKRFPFLSDLPTESLESVDKIHIKNVSEEVLEEKGADREEMPFIKFFSVINNVVTLLESAGEEKQRDGSWRVWDAPTVGEQLLNAPPPNYLVRCETDETKGMITCIWTIFICHGINKYIEKAMTKAEKEIKAFLNERNAIDNDNLKETEEN